MLDGHLAVALVKCGGVIPRRPLAQRAPAHAAAAMFPYTKPGDACPAKRRGRKRALFAGRAAACHAAVRQAAARIAAVWRAAACIAAAMSGGAIGGSGCSNGGGGTCAPDSDGVAGGVYTIDLVVDDTGFSKTVLSTQNDATVTLTLTNNGNTPHGFAVGCTSVLPAYPNLPAGCPATSCFPSGASIAPLAPGATKTITFFTPTPDNLIYPFTSNEPADSAVPGLNDGQWTLM
jgi:hypothetical protein